MTDANKEGLDTYLIGEWVIVEQRTIGTMLVPIDLLAGWMSLWSKGVLLDITGTLYVPAGTPMPDVVAAYEWHINADGVRDAG